MSLAGDAPPTILFAQVNSFSYTNDALAAALKPHLTGFEIATYRAYPAIRRNPLLFALCLVAVLYYYGPRAAFDRKALPERFIKTPLFFRLASLLIRRRARSYPNLKAVFQTQGLFDGKIGELPLVLYTDNTILNLMDDASRTPVLEDERRLYKIATHLCVAAGHVRDSLLNFYQIGRDKISVVLIGANAPPAPPSPPDRFERRRILFIGVEWERKGGPELIEAFQNVHRAFPNATLTIVGCSPDLQVPGVEVVGRVSLGQVAELISQASIFCMPSHIEPFGIAVVEAARSGLPVIGTPVGGMLESIVDGETGILVPAGNVAALEEALGRLVADPPLCQRMGASGREWAKRFEWSEVAEKIADELKRQIDLSTVARECK